MAGGGPVVGYGQRGFVYGAEVDGGLTLANLTLGAQHSDHTIVYAAFATEGAVDGPAQDLLDTTHAYWRLGGGVGLTSTTGRDGYDTIHSQGIALTGLGVAVPMPAHAQGCVSSGRFAAATVEFRYVGDWEVVLVPRLEYTASICSE